MSSALGIKRPDGHSRRDHVRSTARDIGERIRIGRALRRMSQESLGAALGISFQQVQKYENGVNRVAACTLVAIAAELDLDVGFFFPTAAAPLGQAEVADIRAEIVEARLVIETTIERLSTLHVRLRGREDRIDTAPKPTRLEFEPA